MKGRPRAKEGKPQGVVPHISLQEDYGGFRTQTLLKNQKEAMVNQIRCGGEKKLCLLGFSFGVLHLFCCDSVIS